ncbi:GNAT family N-acetyltransferase [Kiloniella sp.]|uniref:GNAT family N-acetyltransferase n=1 Tax=Kiloniella sp. TaxID=1938587 RepID=UPI003B016755
MKESLENVGRFDPDRARTRFVETFKSTDTVKIVHNDEIVAFYMLTTMDKHFWLNHLYIKPDFQGYGIGSRIMAAIFVKSKEQVLPVKLCALKESKANIFYKNHGFVETHSDEWDHYYTRAETIGN